MLKFQLFRIKIYPLQQRKLFEPDMEKHEMLRKLIDSLPSAELRKGMTWHLGNLTRIDDKGLYFRVGRTSKSTLEIYDKDKGSFLDQEFPTAPYTHVVVDLYLEICAIAHKSTLSQKTSGISRQLKRLFNESEEAKSIGVEIEIDEIKDPEDFITHMKSAYSISKFWVTVARPNPFDVDGDFIKPFQSLVEEAKSDTGKAELKGENLNSDTLSSLARSAAATGDDAAAWLKPSQEERQLKKQLKENTVNVSQESIDDHDALGTLLNSVRTMYEKIRGDGKNQ